MSNYQAYQDVRIEKNKEPRHSQIWTELGRLEMVIERAEQLVDRIRNQGRPEEKTTGDMDSGSLAIVLEKGPVRINILRERLKKAIDEIDADLFG